MENLSDSGLLARIQQGDHRAFASLVDRYADVLFRFIDRRINSVADTQDIVQDVFISLWKNRQGLIIKDSLRGYLFQGARYETIDWMVRRDKEIANKKMLSELHGNNGAAPCDALLIGKEVSLLVEEEVERMPKTMKRVFLMSRSNNMSVKDIAIHLMISEQTVKNNISMALGRLRSKFKREHFVLWLLLLQLPQ